MSACRLRLLPNLGLWRDQIFLQSVYAVSQQELAVYSYAK